MVHHSSIIPPSAADCLVTDSIAKQRTKQRRRTLLHGGSQLVQNFKKSELLHLYESSVAGCCAVNRQQFRRCWHNETACAVCWPLYKAALNREPFVSSSMRMSDHCTNQIEAYTAHVPLHANLPRRCTAGVSTVRGYNLLTKKNHVDWTFSWLFNDAANVWAELRQMVARFRSRLIPQQFAAGPFKCHYVMWIRKGQMLGSLVPYQLKQDDLEGSSRCLTEALFRNFHRGTNENIGKLQARYSMSPPRFKPHTSGTEFWSYR